MAFFTQSPNGSTTYRNRSGRKGKLLSVLADAKTQKSTGVDVLTGILYLAPADNLRIAAELGTYTPEQIADAVPGAQLRAAVRSADLCPFATDGCRAACLYTAGRGRMSNVMQGRLRKTEAYHTDRVGFINALHTEIRALVKSAARKGLRPAVRLNGTSDIAWETIAPELFARHPNVQFYDYTKSTTRAQRWADGLLPSNYHLTYSVSEAAGSFQFAVNFVRHAFGVAAIVLEGGYRVALATLGSAWARDGDAHDARFQESGTFAVLSPKGDAKADSTGFVFRAETLSDAIYNAR